ncbi:MAG: hypothetical protein SFV22_04975 [Saprospiraceae bacterium]|nr:hypothetical protein [Saprospiraceae bacterium]
MNTRKILTLLLLVFLAGRSIAQPPPALNNIYGNLFQDIDGDCIWDPFEIGMENWTMRAIVFDSLGLDIDTLYGTTDADGYYAIVVPPTQQGGSFIEAYLSPLPPPDFDENCTIVCENIERVFSGGPGFDMVANIGFHCDTLPPCPTVEIDIASGILRPCFETTFYLNYRNNTSLVITDATVELTFDQPLQVNSASLPYTANGNVYTFDLGDLTAFQSGNFTVKVFTPCDEPVGQTYCVEAHAFPDTCQAPPGANWDGSSITVAVDCNDDQVIFTLRNVGPGNMSAPLEYIVIEDNVLLMQSPGQFQLNSNESMQFEYPANGSFYRFEAQQSPGAPNFGIPAAWAEGCGDTGPQSLGFVNQYNLGDDAPWLDIFCIESVNSYDPNDKQGFPRGVGEAHYIDQNVDIEYLIRFQNTGTAPAINIEIRDTLPVQWLDPNTVRTGASSHPYEFDMAGNGVMVFKFPNINLPDSNANLEASQGFVKFRISQRKDVPLETEITNSAAIFFDFNDPIITNQTLHTVGKDYLILSGTQENFLPGLEIQVMPHPFRGEVTVLANNMDDTGSELEFTLVSTLGRQVLRGTFSGNRFIFDGSQLPAGLYGYEIHRQGQLAATGKLLKM